ncbi:serine/threonine-protein kinase ATM [Zeugodacus cucurbitae]|uniref:serine/threonine-protein kinase ATM n=1 Tax=Zeugodacus cucurbitae TaxID=28588 RepID=UPI0023D95B83|nr:serine/threonine-protein kinase ATM [Zeugodacus cucurbitae]XP_054087417.1 serine/threonine-protein kinase ATM [Zeugodacus cucurbitae]
MSTQLQQIATLCPELRSDKTPTRNKAMERLETILVNSKDELIQRLRGKHTEDITWNEIFCSAIDAVLKHAAKVVELKDQKSIQAMLNKNHIYRSVIHKLIDYNLENSNNFLTKSSIYHAFCSGFTTTSAVKIFGSLFIQIVERGIYKCPTYVQEMKVDEYGNILSNLFEITIPGDEILHFEVLSCIVKTIELAVQHVHIQDEIVDYFPEILPFARRASDDRKKSDVIKLYYFFISQLTIDYHYTICESIQDTLPVLCDMYNLQLKPEIKEIFFSSIYLSIHAIYPNINNGCFKTMKIKIKDSWKKTLNKLKSVVELEIRERKTTIQRSIQSGREKYLESFIDMASVIVYVIFWHINANTDVAEMNEPLKKVSKVSDKLDIILRLIQSDNTINETWFAILAALLNTQRNIINLSNYQELLQFVSNVLNISANVVIWKSIRRSLIAILKFEDSRSSCSDKVYMSYSEKTWIKIVDFLISESSESNDIITEKQILLQELIKHDKLSFESSKRLIQAIISNSILRRTETFETIRTILIYSDICGIDKNSNIIEQILKWAFEVNEKINTRSILQNIDPVDITLINDTCAIAVINFLNEQQIFTLTSGEDEIQMNFSNLNVLQYKYNIKFVCLEEHGKAIKLRQNAADPDDISSEELSNCLFQNTYELLMRTLNIEISKQTKCASIVSDMTSLNKLADLMKAFLNYGVFTNKNLIQCPLIKRIGFFLSHMEFQLKSNDPRSIERTELLEVLQYLESFITTFTSSGVLTQFLETQPLEELINFLGTSLSHSASQHLQTKASDWAEIRLISLRILAELCASTTYQKDAFHHISRYVFNIHHDLDILLPLIKIFCKRKRGSEEENLHIGEWFVDKLKLIFRLYYMDLKIIERLVAMLPEIFEYVYSNSELLDTMFVALTSLLKIAYKKNYPTKITGNLIERVRLISRKCEGIWMNEGFISICVSVMKFLSFPSLQIQLSVISTVTSLMDSNWLASSTTTFSINEHYKICELLFSAINWKNLSDATPDLSQNRNSVVMQLLVALFAFSSYYQENALIDLVNFYAARKLTEDDFCEFAQVANFFGCSQLQLVKPYMNGLITSWISKEWPISKFPYFLCYSTKEDFMTENISIIAAGTLLYIPNGDIKKLNRYANDEELIKIAHPILEAYMLPYKASCPESQTQNYKKYMNVLNENINRLGWKLPTSRTIDWKTIHFCCSILKVDSLSTPSFEFPTLHATSSWNRLNYESLKQSLKLYLMDPNHVGECETQTLFSPICSHPLQFLKVLSALKADVYACIFSNERSSCFYKYCTAIDLITDSIPTHIASTRDNSIAEYIVRDAVLFLSQCLQNVQYTELHLTGLMFLQCLFQKPFISIGGGKGVISNHLNEITKCLVAIVEKNCFEKSKLSLKLLHSLIADFGENTMIFTQLPATENFMELREIQSKRSASPSNTKDLLDILESSILVQKCSNDTLGTLRQLIIKFKVCAEDQHFCDLVRRLLEVVCNAHNKYLRLDAARCLGEIGSLEIANSSFYFEMNSSFYDNITSSMAGIEIFSISVAKVLDKILTQFNAITYEALFKVTTQLMNSKCTKSIIELYPYLAIFQQSNNKKNQDWDPSANIEPIDWLCILNSTETLEWDKWISLFVSKVLESCGWTALGNLASRDMYVANEILLPFITLLMSNKERHILNIMSMLAHYFKTLYMFLGNSENDQMRAQEIYKDKRIIKTFLKICECIRIHNQCSVPMNLLYVAKASNHCQAFFMTIMYTELWAMSEKTSNDKQTMKEEYLKNPAFQEVATKAYKSIGCHDAISGFLSPLQSRLEFLNITNDWSEMLLQNSFKDTASNTLCTSALKRNGILCLADLGNKGSTNSVDYEVCWRLCQWDTPVEGHLKVNVKNDPELEFNKHHFNALKCLYNREEQNCLAAIANARQCVIHNLMGISTECLQSVYKYLTWLHLLQQAEDFCQVQFISEVDIKSIFSKWQSENKLKYGSFHCKELVLSHQITLFKTAGVRGQRRIIDFFKYSPTETGLINIIKECQKSGEINLAKRNILALRETEITNEHVKLNLLIEDAEISFRSGSIEITEALLKHALTHKELGACPQQARALRLYGEFLLETNSQSFEYVLEKMFNRSMFYLEKILKSQNYKDNEELSFLYLEDLKPAEFKKENKKQAYQLIAKYADREYVQSNVYMNSDEFKLKCQIIQENRQKADSVGRQPKDRDINHGIIIMKKNAYLDETEIKFIEEKRSNNLCIAVRNYIKFCQIDSGFSNAAIYRIIALWFANKLDKALHTEIKDNVDIIPSYKFICALNQITARLNTQHADFIIIIKEILVKCLQDHPHHTLYQLYPLIFDDAGGKTNKSRSTIAAEIITKGRNSSNSQSTKQLAMVFPALIQFANADCGKGPIMPLYDKLKVMKNLDAVICPTIELPVLPSKDYTIISIVRWDESVSLVGGINAPKKLKCLCSDGKSRPQLLKGRDDLRQDAVMQQYFSLMNILLGCDAKTSEQKINIRTYKVVPLSMRSGILEWCENTVPIGVYLGSGSDKSGAHRKYRPDDITPHKCRQISMSHLKSDIQKRMSVYEEICAKIKPVFHYFLLEKFLVPGIWFERRLAYIHSLAVNSMVGFVVGLGDRHTQNILVDEKTAEVIHIDFGIAFEQGKIMPTPETVPFRLTRDMVAPMGICETGGMFKKACQSTLEVLRKNQSVIITILEVLLYDPLYIWNVVQTPSGSIADEKNLTAQRALLCVQHKLEGRLSNITGTVNTDVQVQRLINDAVSKQNLCRLYPGWDPYL